VGRSLSREDGSVVYNCCWSSPAQSFSGPRPVALVTIFYCLIFETSHFVASYDSQGHGGGIRPRLQTGHYCFLLQLRFGARYIALERTAWKTPPPTPLLLLLFLLEQPLHCCFSLCRRGNVLTKPMLSNGRLFRLL
jgi:hypothetical protein